MKELDRLAAALAGLSRNNGSRSKIATRLAAIAKDFEAGIAGATADAPPADREVELATDDEMFDLIDRELGISEQRA
jgi:hypothetical protein